MISPTYGEITFENMCRRIKSYIRADLQSDYTLTIGTDSQNHEMTKVVLVVAVCRKGKGGIFFYDIRRVKLIDNLRRKIFYETNISLEAANRITEYISLPIKNTDVLIHVDIGENGKTNALIPEITGWVSNLGYQCLVKPDSYAASSIANRLSK